MTDKTEETSRSWAFPGRRPWTVELVVPANASRQQLADALDDALTGETARILLARLRSGTR